MTPAQLKIYLEKIGFEGECLPTLENLIKIVEGQIFTVPFETLDLHDSALDKLPNRGTTFDFDTHFNRIIYENRGGHCAVLNLILLRALESVGFKVKPILPDTLRQIKANEEPSSHCAGIVSLPEGDYLVDAGFGGVGLLSPIPLKEGEYQQYSEKFKVAKGKKYDFEIYIQNNKDWERIYGIKHQPSSYKAFEEVNKIQTDPRNPDCSFRFALLCTKPFKIDATHNGRLRLFNTKFTRYENEIIVKENRADNQAKYHTLLKNHFNINLSPHKLRLTKMTQDAFLDNTEAPAPIPSFTPLYGTRRKQSAVKMPATKQRASIPRRCKLSQTQPLNM